MLKKLFGSMKAGRTGAEAVDILVRLYNVPFDVVKHRMDLMVKCGYADINNEHELAIIFLCDLAKEFDPSNAMAKAQIRRYIRKSKRSRT